MSNVLEGLKYTREHEWVKIDGNKAVIGITDFAQHELGDIVFVELPSIGYTVKINDSFGTVESVKTVSDLFAPVSGHVVEVNSDLENSPEVVNNSPYENGWMVVIEIDNPAELDELLDAEAYTRHIEG